MDLELRRIERRMRAGEFGAEEEWRRKCGRRGLYFRDRRPAGDLTEWEEIQADYDDIWWHRKSVKTLKFTGYCRCCCDFNTWARKLVKAKDMAWRSNWGDNNAKRKTLRTHRDGSRRNYRLRGR